MDKNKTLAKKILSKAEFDEMKHAGDAKSIIKGATEHMNTNQIAPIVDGQELKDKTNLGKIKLAARKFQEAGQMDKASDLIKKAMESKAFKRVSENVAKRGIKSLPVIGTLGAALMQKDASAAIPGDADVAGPEKGSPEYDFENDKMSKEEKDAFIRSRLKQSKRPNK